MNKIIILENNGGRLANQLWQFANIYSYCLEKEYRCENYCFFRYAHYFNFVISNKFVFLLFFKSYEFFKNIKLIKFFYLIYTFLVKNLFNKKVVNESRPSFLLPPSDNQVVKQIDVLKSIDSKNNSKFYFCGWLFDNPAGLKKYHKEIVESFRPKKEYYFQVQDFISNLRKNNKKLVGVHIRQGDFKNWEGGKYYFSLSEVRKNLDNFLEKQPIFKKDNIIFVLCSDGAVDKEIFSGLNVVDGPGSEILDLYTLAATDLIIGNPASTYGAWAAYYGNIPIVEFSRGEIDLPVLKIL